MKTYNILLSDSLNDFLSERIATSGYSSFEEYIYYLIEQDQKTAAQEQLESLLLEGLESVETIEVTDEWWEQKRLKLLNKISQNQRSLFLAIN
ncbi:type II toxin-antitoxin system ParD family antitoxin [Aphanothece hegewaldii CCALA 016]|uniref:Type II toxin-antitoxin system ParD family antitoxin n=1 Tax=Aphanothece hegewaldii CCALA 016 TaxID=2107694 RepID=A0A2T1LTQ6_9CHRO|nr:type II toxin-antitoxin system ParD family antitoxin [Aphanothece hegewaldii]PSF34495.1 type II toxin-antitoxin system ParD family antitoxin [Aphanothece hegewaldii CCALA 016]